MLHYGIVEIRTLESVPFYLNEVKSLKSIYKNALWVDPLLSVFTWWRESLTFCSSWQKKSDGGWNLLAGYISNKSSCMPTNSYLLEHYKQICKQTLKKDDHKILLVVNVCIKWLIQFTWFSGSPWSISFYHGQFLKILLHQLKTNQPQKTAIINAA